MKWIGFLMSVYMLALSFFPCGDVSECDVQRLVSISAASDHQHHSHSGEQCTPFCTCSCCAVSVVLKQVSPFELRPFKHISPSYSFYRPSHCEEISVGIWQPPKLS
jgi:hypothetical protein